MILLEPKPPPTSACQPLCLIRACACSSCKKVVYLEGARDRSMSAIDALAKASQCRGRGGESGLGKVPARTPCGLCLFAKKRRAGLARKTADRVSNAARHPIEALATELFSPSRKLAVLGRPVRWGILPQAKVRDWRVPMPSLRCTASGGGQSNAFSFC